MLRECKECHEEKDINEFVKKKCKKGIYYLHTCRNCYRENYKAYHKKYAKTHKAAMSKSSKKWQDNNKEKTKEHRLKNKEHKREYDKKYRIKNKTKINKRTNKYWKNRRKKDPFYKLRRSVSGSISYYLKVFGSSKNKQSVLKYLPYTIRKLKKYLESKFESWMNWENYGNYRVETWKDDDPKTWKWNIDHIKPQSTLPYISMEDENFKICWALENLRPYSAKQNTLDGNRREESKVKKPRKSKKK